MYMHMHVMHVQACPPHFDNPGFRNFGVPPPKEASRVYDTINYLRNSLLVLHVVASLARSQIHLHCLHALRALYEYSPLRCMCTMNRLF